MTQVFLESIDYSTELDDLAQQFGSDKGTKRVNGLSGKGYTEIYSKYFGPLKCKEIVILEIGVYKGASMKMWEEFFPQARVFGIDIDPKCKQYESKRTAIFIGDQTDVNFLQHVVTSIGQEFDIIIDDGGHKMREHQITLNFLFPLLKLNGIYCIEDLHTAYWTKFGGGYRNQNSTIEHLKDLIDQINIKSIAIENNRSNFITNLFRKPVTFPDSFNDLDTIHFYKSLVVLLKKQTLPIKR